MSDAPARSPDPAADAALQADLLRINLIIAQVRAEVGDDQINMIDVSSIIGAAREFCVSRRNAYLRARQICLLSWQEGPVDV